MNLEDIPEGWHFGKERLVVVVNIEPGTFLDTV